MNKEIIICPFLFNYEQQHLNENVLKEANSFEFLKIIDDSIPKRNKIKKFNFFNDFKKVKTLLRHYINLQNLDLSAISCKKSNSSFVSTKGFNFKHDKLKIKQILSKSNTSISLIETSSLDFKKIKSNNNENNDIFNENGEFELKENFLAEIIEYDKEKENQKEIKIVDL